MKKGIEADNNHLDPYQLMFDNELIFFPSDPDSLKKLIEFVMIKNHAFYKEQKFQYIPSEFDQHLIVAASPKLGNYQLGVYAGKNFEKDQEIARYEGENLWGIRSTKEIKKQLKNYNSSGDYCWEVQCKNRKSMAVNSITCGNISRFVNDSLEKNAEVEITEDGQILYKAKRKIKFGEEITVNYGKQFFSKQNPRKAYRPETLQTILSQLYCLKYKESLSLEGINNIDAIKIFLNALGFNRSVDEKIQSHPGEGFLALPEKRHTSSKNNIYLDEEGFPFFFNIADETQTKTLSTKLAVKLHKTSNYQLYVAPTGFIEGRRKLSLFAGEFIGKNQPICIIKGEILTRKQLSQRKIEENFLFTINPKTNIYCEHESSEALFLHGVNNEANANVLFVIKKGTPSYIAIRDISPGEEIVAFFGADYTFGNYVPTHLATVITEFNKHQLIWDAHLSYNMQKNSYSLKLTKHVAQEKLVYSDPPIIERSTIDIKQDQQTEANKKLKELYQTHLKEFSALLDTMLAPKQPFYFLKEPNNKNEINNDPIMNQWATANELIFDVCDTESTEELQQKLPQPECNPIIKNEIDLEKTARISIKPCINSGWQLLHFHVNKTPKTGKKHKLETSSPADELQRVKKQKLEM